ncbi:MAG TPA: HRDC domain-containing protein [Gemmatimonadales bacterium]|nr:HRDC domain-containing protein [Gemmatimonadales bacterium]
MTSELVPAVISAPDDLAQAVERIAATGRVAVDTEAASFHRYADRVFLVQLTSEAETVVVDPLTAGDLAPLGSMLGDARVEVVFHDADYDLRILDRDYGFRATRVFDTRIAAHLLGEPSVGLSALLDKHLGVRLNKRFQRADWSARPLPAAMLAYAASDTRYLLPLRDLMATRLQEAGRLHWAQEEFVRLEGLRWTPPDRQFAHLLLPGARGLSPRGRTVLRALYEWREDTACALDRPPFRVAPHEALVALAAAAPVTPEDLARVPGLPASIARRYASSLLHVIREGGARAIVLDDRPRRGPGRPDAETERRLARLKQFRALRSTVLGLEPGVLCPNATLLAIARAAPDSPERIAAVQELRRWQREALTDEGILEQVAGETGPAGPQ